MYSYTDSVKNLQVPSENKMPCLYNCDVILLSPTIVKKKKIKQIHKPFRYIIRRQLVKKWWSFALKPKH